MIDRILPQIWWLMLIAVLAYRPALYVCRYIANDSPRRDITRPGVDLSWRSRRELGVSLLLLAALIALAVFSLTPRAVQMIRSVAFQALLLGGAGLYLLYTVINGFLSGRLSPAIRGVYGTFDRASEPWRFWASMGWNGLLGLLMLWLGYVMVPELAKDRCYDSGDQAAAQRSIATCSQLIADHADDDDVPRWLAVRGSAYYRLDDDRRALADYDRSLGIDPHQSSTLYNRGLAHDRLGDYRAAAADYSAAIREDPDDADAYLMRGVIHFDDADFESAVADFTRAHALKPARADLLVARARAYRMDGKEALAGQDIESARALDPSSPDLLEWDIKWALDARDWRGAVALLTAGMARYPDEPWFPRRRAAAYRELGETDKARADDARAEALEGAAKGGGGKAGVSAP